jgi:hypothetical protein
MRAEVKELLFDVAGGLIAELDPLQLRVFGQKWQNDEVQQVEEMDALLMGQEEGCLRSQIED